MQVHFRLFCAVFSLPPQWIGPMSVSTRTMRVGGCDCWEKLLLCGERKGFPKKKAGEELANG